MKRIAAFAVVLLLTMTATAAPTNTTLTVKGVQYEDIRWGTVTPATVTIFHKTGIARLRLADLTADLQQQFHYDPQKAQVQLTAEAQQQAALAEADTKRRAELAKRREAERSANSGATADHLWKKVGNDVIDFAPYYKALLELETLRNNPPQAPQAQAIHTSTYRGIGDAVDSYNAGKHYVTTAEWQMKQDELTKFLREAGVVVLRGKIIQIIQSGILLSTGDQNIFLKNAPDADSKVDGDFYETIAMSAGRHKYVNTMGAETTVRCFDCGVPVEK